MKFLATLLIFSFGTLYGQKARNYPVVTAELTNKIVSAPVAVTPVRLAVVPFTATTSSVQASTQFGEYLTETIIGQLGDHGDKVKLFERTRLDAILKEHEFILTDMMKPAAALKIGQLAPIDALLSGTYTKLKSYIDVSARLIDVASGEILVSFNGRIKMNKNLAALFPTQEHAAVMHDAAPSPVPVVVTIQQAASTSPAKSEAEVCKERVAEFQTRLHDLSSPEKIQSVAQEAMRTPFDNRCGQLHYHLMYAFTRYSIDHREYKQFLLQTLDTIAFPAGDERAMEITRYLSADGLVDDAEWAAAFHAFSRVGNYSLSSYLSYLIAKPSKDPSAAPSRIAAYFTSASAGKIGLPRPVAYEIAFFEMMEGLRSNNDLGQHVYQTYSAQLLLDDKTKPTLFSNLHALYKSETTPAKKTAIMGWICDYVNANDYTKAHEQLYDLAWDFNLTLNESRNEEIRRDFPVSDLNLLTSRCGKKFADYVMSTTYRSQQEDRINFCVQNNIPVPGIIPTMTEARTILSGTSLDEQLRVMKLLVQMGDRPKVIESTLVTLFSKRSLEDRNTMDEIQTLAMVVLGNCRTASAQAITYMIDALPHYGNDTEAAKKALTQIGKPAVPQLIARLDKTTNQDGGLQYQLITLLGNIGKPAAPAEKSIRRVLAQHNNGDVRYAAEAALQAIGSGDR